MHKGHRAVRIFSLWPKRRTAVYARCSGHNLSLPFKALYNNTLTYDYSLRSQRGTVTNAREWGRNSVESCGCLRNEDLIKYRHVCMIITGESYSARWSFWKDLQACLQKFSSHDPPLSTQSSIPCPIEYIEYVKILFYTIFIDDILIIIF